MRYIQGYPDIIEAPRIGTKAKKKNSKRGKHMIKIYGTPACQKCVQLKKVCENANLKFDYINALPGDDNFNLLLEAGVRSFPAISFNDTFISSKSIPDFIQIIEAHQ